MRLIVRVKPNSRTARVTEQPDGSLTVWVDAPARDGEANNRLTELLAAHFGVSKSCVTLHRGAGARVKAVEVLQ